MREVRGQKTGFKAGRTHAQRRQIAELVRLHRWATKMWKRSRSFRNRRWHSYVAALIQNSLTLWGETAPEEPLSSSREGTRRR